MNVSTTTTAIVGIILGIIYYNFMKHTIPDNHKNCSFVANIWTDIIAFIVGGIIAFSGYKYKDNILIASGIAIITEHILQFEYKGDI